MHERHAGARKPVLNCLYHGLEEDGDTGDRVGNSRRNSEDPVVYCGQDVLSHLTCLVSNNQVGGRAEQDEVSGQSAHPRDEHPVVTGGSQVSHRSRDVSLDQKNQRHVGDNVREQDDHNSEEGSAVVGWVGSAAGERGPEEVVGVTGLHTSRDQSTPRRNFSESLSTRSWFERLALAREEMTVRVHMKMIPKATEIPATSTPMKNPTTMTIIPTQRKTLYVVEASAVSLRAFFSASVRMGPSSSAVSPALSPPPTSPSPFRYQIKSMSQLMVQATQQGRAMETRKL